MAGAEVVGTAFVRVRALTKQLSDDIKKGVDKGIKDAKVNDEGREAGDEFADGFNESSSDGIQAGLKDTFEDDDTDRTAEEGGERGGEKWSDGFRNKLNTSMGDTFNRVFRRGDRDRDIQLGGEDDGKTYGDGFRDGLGDDREGGIFSGLLSGLSRGIGGALRGIGGLLGSLADGGGGGDDSGSGFGKKFAAGFKKGFASVMSGFAKVAMSLIFNPVVLIGSLLVAITPLLINGIVALGSMIGTLLSAAIGGGVAIAVAGIGALSLAPILAAFLVDTPLLELFKEEMKEIGEAFKVTAELVQEQVLPGVLLLAETLVDSLLPAIDDFAIAAGDAFGDFMEHLSDLISGAGTIERIGNILEGSAEGFRAFLQSLIPLTDFALRIFEGLAPISKTVADDMNVMFTRWNEWAEGVGASGLEATFRGFYDTFKLVMGGLTDITVALFNILMIGDSATGQGFFERFREWAREWREFTTSDAGIARYTEMFERAQPVLSEFAGLLGDIMRLLFAGATSEGATSGTVGALQWLRNDVIPWFTDTGFPGLKGAIDTVSGVVGGVVTALTPFATAMKEAFSPAVESVIEYLGERGPELLDTFRSTLEDLEDPLTSIGESLATGLTPFFGVLQAFADSGALELVLQSLVVLFEILAAILAIPGMAEFIGMMAGMAVVFMTVSKFVVPVIGFLKVLLPILGALTAGSVGIIFAIVLAIVALAVAIIANWESIKEFFTELPEKLEGFKERFKEGLDKLKEKFEEVWDKFTDTVGKIPGKLTEFVTSIPGRLAGLGRSILRAFSDALTAVGTWLVTEGIPRLITFFAELPGKIVGAIGNLGEPLGGIFNAAVDFLMTDLPIMFIRVLGFFLGIPQMIFEALTALGTFIGDAFRAAWDFLWEEMPKLFEKIRVWFVDLPGNILGFLSETGNKIRDAFKAAWDFLKEKMPELFQTVKDWIVALPGNIWTFLMGDGQTTGLFAKIRDAFKSAFDSVKTWLEEKGTQIIEWFQTLPEKVRTAAKEIVAALKDELEGKLDWVTAIPIVGPAIGSLDTLFGANGGIFDRATPIIIGEAGKEVLIPLTRPARAMQLAMQSGLFDVLSQSTRQAPMSPVVIGGGGGGSTDRDLDRIADRIVAALPEAGDTVQLVMPPGIGRSNAVAVAMESTRQLRSDRWRRGK